MGARLLSSSLGPRWVDDGTGFSLYGGVDATRYLSLELGWMLTNHLLGGYGYPPYPYPYPSPYAAYPGPGPFGPELGPGFGGYPPPPPYNPAAHQLFTGFTADLKGYLRPYGFRPFVQGGVGCYILGHAPSGSSTGTGFQLGGGVDLMFGRNIGLTARFLYRGMDISPSYYEPRQYVSVATGELGASLHF
jgi:hypothetical protein